MAQVSTGLDVLVSRLSGLIKRRRVGLLCHQASITRDLTRAVDAIRALPGVTPLAALFAPEHGIAGTAQDPAYASFVGLPIPWRCATA
jgi:uncharacterized protein YbbC (DUF1343 family)